jgi:hypothetical protein
MQPSLGNLTRGNLRITISGLYQDLLRSYENLTLRKLSFIDASGWPGRRGRWLRAMR